MVFSSVSEHDLTNLFCKASFQEVPKCRTLCDKTIIIFLIIEMFKRRLILLGWH